MEKEKKCRIMKSYKIGIILCFYSCQTLDKKLYRFSKLYIDFQVFIQSIILYFVLSHCHFFNRQIFLYCTISNFLANHAHLFIVCESYVKCSGQVFLIQLLVLKLYVFFCFPLTSEYRAASLADSSPASVPLAFRVEPKPKSGIR